MADLPNDLKVDRHFPLDESPDSPDRGIDRGRRIWSRFHKAPDKYAVIWNLKLPDSPWCQSEGLRKRFAGDKLIVWQPQRLADPTANRLEPRESDVASSVAVK